MLSLKHDGNTMEVFMKEDIFKLVMQDCEHEVLDDSTIVTFFPKINYGYISSLKKWIFGTSMSSVIATYYMDMDALSLEELYG